MHTTSPSYIPPPVDGVDASKTYGPMLIATLVAMALWGVTCLQTFMYFVNYESDGWCLKTLVIVLWFLDTVHEALCIEGVWRTLIPVFDPIAYFDYDPVFMWQIAVTGFIAAVAQGFYVWRIWRFSKKLIFPIILVPLTLIEMSLSFFLGSLPDITLPISRRGRDTSARWADGLGGIVLILSVIYTVTDIFIAVVIYVFLRRRRTGFKSTDNMVVRLISVSVGTGACTAVFATLSLVLVIADAGTFFFFLGDIPLCTLYCNAVLANLNSRRYLRGSNTVIGSSFNRISVGTAVEMRPVPSAVLASKTAVGVVDGN